MWLASHPLRLNRYEPVLCFKPLGSTFSRCPACPGLLILSAISPTQQSCTTDPFRADKLKMLALNPDMTSARSGREGHYQLAQSFILTGL